MAIHLWSSSRDPVGLGGRSLRNIDHLEGVAEVITRCTSMTIGIADRTAQMASDAGALAENVAGAARPSSSTLGRLGKTVAAVKIGARLIPTGWRLLKRYPVGSSLVIVALGAIWYGLRQSGPDNLRRPTRLAG